MSKETRATLELSRLGIAFSLHAYDYDPEAASIKKLAAAFGGKAAKMMRPTDAERLTGYRVGGISPFGQKKKVPTAIEETALALPKVFVNGGQRGLQIELDPNDAAIAAGARAHALTA